MKFIIYIFLLLNSFSFLAQNSPIDSIPFKLEKDNRIYTYCKVNESDSLCFLIDTGATDMVINSERLSKVDMKLDFTVENMGTTGVNSVEHSSENIFSWGNQKLNKTSFISIPIQNELWDGIIGLSVLKKYVVKIDYDRKLIYLYDKEKYQWPKSSGMKIKYAHGVPIINVNVETIDKKMHKLRLEVDTGSDRIIDISTSYTNNNKLLDVYKTAFATSKVSGSSDGSDTGVIYNVYFPKVKIFEHELYKIPGGVAQIQYGIMNTNEIDGMIGNWFLKRFNLTFDFKNDYLYLEPNNHLYSPFFDFLTE